LSFGNHLLACEGGKRIGEARRASHRMKRGSASHMNPYLRLRIVARAVTMTLLFLGAPAAKGKVGDCKPICDGPVLFRSHANYVEAYDIAHQMLLWHTELFSDKYLGVYDPKIEEDAQWNIACVTALQGDIVQVTDGNGKRYDVDKNSGSVIESK
jgi:hypothetical protein